MKLRNFTDIDNEVIREIIRKVRPSGISNFDVRISNTSQGFCGTAYTRGSGFHATASPFIVCRIAKTEFMVRSCLEGGNGYLPMQVGSRMEALVVVLAHELRHLWQASHKRGRVYGSRGRMSERDADAYALSCLRKFRRGELT